MLFINRLLVVGLLSVGIAAATTAQAANQLFEGSWTVKAFGNEITGVGTGASAIYSAWGIPQGIQCNDKWPRCPFASTPTIQTKSGYKFHPLGGTQSNATFCAPWYNWQGLTTGNGAKTGTMRPAKGDTVFETSMTGMGGTNKLRPIPPLYRNPRFFTASTSNAMPNWTYCNATTTNGSGGPGFVMKGNPITGTWSASTTGSPGKGGFNFPAAPAVGTGGFRTTGLIADFQNIFPYIYSYTYATLRNDVGAFAPSAGPGSFTLSYTMGKQRTPPDGKGQAQIYVKQGAAKFGGTMRMLGALTTKVCYFRNQACSLGENNWRYDAVGASAYTSGSVITEGYIATYKAYYYHTGLMQKSTVNVEGARFPWTTGSVTLKATGRGPHKTVHYGQGYDNRTPTTGKGTVQLVTPVLTRWLQPAVKFETGGVGILRIKLVPEPQTWAMLVAGVLLLGVGNRMRGR